MGIDSTDGPFGSFITDVVATVHEAMTRCFQVPIVPSGAAAAPWRGADLEIPRAGDPARFAFDEGFVESMLMKVPDLQSLASVVVPVDRVVPASSSRAREARVGLYRLILRAGEPVPPILVERTGDQWRVLDGWSRVAAARLEGVANLVGLCVG